MQPGFSLLLREKCKRREKSKKELLSKREPELEDWEYSQHTCIAKHEKACSGENIKNITEQSFAKEIMGVTQRSSKPFQQKPE